MIWKIYTRPKANGFEARATVKGERHSRWRESEEEAVSALQAYLSAMSLPKRPTFLMCAHSYLETLRGKSEKRQQQAYWAVSHLRDIHNVEIAEITRPVLQNIFARMPLGRSKKIVKEHAYGVWNLAVADDHAAKNIAQFIKLDIPAATRPNILSPEELMRMIECSRGRAVHLPIVCMAAFGVRLQEPAKLTADSFRHSGSVAFEGTKNKSAPRVLPLPEIIGSEISPCIVPWIYHDGNALRGVKRVGELAGVGTWVNGRTFRHSVATNLANLGCPERDIARILGHKHPTITNHYTHADLDQFRHWVELHVASVYVFEGKSGGNTLQLEAK